MPRLPYVVVSDYKIYTHMGILDLLLHLGGFVAPAIFVGALMPLLARFLIRNRPSAPVYIVQAAINIVANLAVLTAGLWYFGHDGKMWTYAALVVAGATCQWMVSRGWRRA